MSHTQGMWTQDGVNTDLQIFVGVTDFVDAAGNATINPLSAGLLSWNLANTKAGTFYSSVTGLHKRTGMYATTATAQQEFGTAASAPGPSSVANTSGTLAQFGFPPTAYASMATLAGATAGPWPKGVQINSIGVIYHVITLGASLATVGVTVTKFVDKTAPVVTNIIALAANGLSTAANGNQYVTNVAVPTPVMLTDADSQVIVNVNLTAGVTGTIDFFGVVLHCSYNFN